MPYQTLPKANMATTLKTSYYKEEHYPACLVLTLFQDSQISLVDKGKFSFVEEF